MGDIERQIEQAAQGVARKESAAIRDNLSRLVESIRDYFEESLDSESKKQYFDKELGKTLSDAIEKSFSKLSEAKPAQVSVKPTINLDLNPIQSIASDISRQNKAIIEVLDKLKSGGNGSETTELYKMCMSMVSKTNSLVERIYNEKDYSVQLSSIAESLVKKTDSEEWEATVTKRQSNGLIEKVVIRSKTS